MGDTPLVVRFDTFPLDVTEHVKLFERSRFNYFRRDDGLRVLMGFWEVENGEEWTDLGVSEWGLAPKDEIILVLEGQIFGSGANRATYAQDGLAQRVRNAGRAAGSRRFSGKARQYGARAVGHRR